MFRTPEMFALEWAALAVGTIGSRHTDKEWTSGQEAEWEASILATQQKSLHTNSTLVVWAPPTERMATLATQSSRDVDTPWAAPKEGSRWTQQQDGRIRPE